MKLLTVSLAFLYFAEVAKCSIDECDHPCQNNGTCHVEQVANNCYYIFPDAKKTWRQTRKFCISQNLTMAKMPKEIAKNRSALQLLLKDLVQGSPVWLGGQADDFKDWTFVNDLTLDQTELQISEAFGEAPSTNKIGCGILLPSYRQGNFFFKVDLEPCYYKKHFLCRFDDWQQTKSLYVSEMTANWHDARSRCLDLGGDLLYLNQGEDFHFLMQKRAAFGNETYFIGIRHRKWLWEGGEEILYYNWNDQEPNKYEENCLMMYSSKTKWSDIGFWNDDKCNETKVSFCQRVSDKNKVGPLPTDSEQDTFKVGFVPGNKVSVPILAVLLCVAGLIIAVLIFYIFHVQPKKNKPQGAIIKSLYLDITKTAAIQSENCSDSPHSTENPQVLNTLGLEETEIIDNPCYESAA